MDAADLRFTGVNARVCRTLGRPAEDIIGKTYSELWLDPETAEQWTVLLRRALAGEILEGETTTRMPDGDVHTYVYVLQPFHDVDAASLSEHGLSATGGDNAVRIVQQHQGTTHLMFTDVVMPGISGHEAAKRVLALRPGIEVIFTSGYTRNGILHEGVIDPGIEFLQKPYTPATLARKIRDILDKPGSKT